MAAKFSSRIKLNNKLADKRPVEKSYKNSN